MFAPISKKIESVSQVSATNGFFVLAGFPAIGILVWAVTGSEVAGWSAPFVLAGVYAYIEIQITRFTD
ncbi:MAG TPA: hypothetical protein PK609_02755 [Candidatus Paceibacterota bacterium]|nr:hypothetical protein [Candidatus Paceibacterota bacterium]